MKQKGHVLAVTGDDSFQGEDQHVLQPQQVPATIHLPFKKKQKIDFE